MDNEIKINPSFWRDDLDDREVMVSIRCTTYNHEPYIRDALEGFVNQKTNFRFEAIVHDDASTDGTAAIIREYAEKYPSIIKPIFETENQYSKRDGSLRRIMDAHMRGKYIAYCEGDDYWIDPLKLQKQVDFLESNPEYGLVHTDYTIKNETGVTINKKRLEYKDSNDVCGNIMLGKYSIATLTVLYRTEVYKNLPKVWIDQKFRMGDLPMWIEISHNTSIKFLNEQTAVYRITDNSASHNKDIKKEIEFYNDVLRCRLFYNQYYNLKIDVTKLQIKHHLMLIKLGYVKKNFELSKEHYMILKRHKIKIPFISMMFYLGSKYKLIDKFICFVYKIMSV